MPNHNTLTKNHVPYTGTFINENERETADDLTTDDIGKTYRQLDDNSYWMLLSESPNPGWKRLDFNIESTTGNMNIYLDPVNGDDIANIGSQASPWKTFTRAFRDIQNLKIKHVIKIFPVAGTYTAFPEYLDLNFEPSGRIIIDGSMNTYPVISGPHTIDDIADVGPATIWGYAVGTDLDVLPAPTSVDSLYGKFCQFTSGNYNGKLVSIIRNNHSINYNMRVHADYHGYQIGDTFNVVDCPVKIDVNHSITIKANDLHQYLSGFNTNNFLVAAVEFKIGGVATYDNMFLENLNANFAFCKLVDSHTDDDDNIPLFLSNTRMNMDWVSGYYYDSDLEDPFTNGFTVLAKNENPNLPDGNDLVYFNNSWPSGLNRIFSRRKFVCTSPSLDIVSCFCGGITTRPGDIYGHTKSTIYVLDLLIHQIAFTENVFDLSNVVLYAESIYIVNGGAPVILYDDSFFRSRWFHGYTEQAYAIYIGWNSTFHVDYPSSRTTIDGVTGFAAWQFDGSGLATKPSEGSFVQKADSFVSVQGGGS